MTDNKLQPSTGCWIDGHWGQYGIARLIEIAETYGYDNMDAVVLAHKHLSRQAMTDGEHEILSDYADGVEEWLNKNVAQEGYSFGWSDGEFFLMSNEWWEEQE